MLKRLPISLKIDDEDGDFYYGFIEEKRKNRELTTLILNLLKLYHTDDVVRKAADDYMVSQSPYLKIHEELQRIALEHKKQTTATGMIGDFARNEMKKTVESEEVHNFNEKSKDESNPDMTALMSQISQMVTESISKALSEGQLKDANISDITNKTMQNVQDTIVGNKPVFSNVEKPTQEVSDEVRKETVSDTKQVPNSFKKMMVSVK